MGNSVVEAFDEAAEQYDRVGVDFFGPFGEELVRRAGLAAGERVLDVGCGRGAVLFPAAHAVGPHGLVTGIDGAPTMVELLRAETAAARLTQVTVEVGDAQQPAFPDRHFDVVTAGLVVFLLADPRSALRAYARLLRPGGRLAMSTFGAQDPVFGEALQALGRHLPEQAGPPPQPDPMFASQEATVAAVTGAGFRDVTCAEFTVVSRFADEQHWLAWCWSHGVRSLLRQIPADRLPAATADTFTVMGKARTPDGDLTMTTTIRTIVGTTTEGASG